MNSSKTIFDFKHSLTKFGGGEIHCKYIKISKFIYIHITGGNFNSPILFRVRVISFPNENNYRFLFVWVYVIVLIILFKKKIVLESCNFILILKLSYLSHICENIFLS